MSKVSLKGDLAFILNPEKNNLWSLCWILRRPYYTALKYTLSHKLNFPCLVIYGQCYEPELT